MEPRNLQVRDSSQSSLENSFWITKIFYLLMLLAACAGVFIANPKLVYACASCGSGGDDPLILNPNDEQRIYFGVSSQWFNKNYLTEGVVDRTPSGPAVRQRYVLVYGARVHPRAFLTFSLPYVRNIRGGDSRGGVSDASVGGRWTIVQPLLTQRLIPQLQFLAAVKHSYARSIFETADAHQLDVLGNGFDQLRWGLDLWSGGTAIYYGVAHTFGHSLARRVQDQILQPGLEMRTTATVGYGFEPIGKILGGVNRSTTQELRQNGQSIASSNALAYNFFVTADAFLITNGVLRMTYSQDMPGWGQQNVAGYQQITTAWMHAF